MATEFENFDSGAPRVAARMKKARMKKARMKKARMKKARMKKKYDTLSRADNDALLELYVSAGK